jgi:hypothetical protein
MAITSYATLTSALSDWAERTYTSAQTDEAIGLAEAEFRLYLGPHFSKETSGTLAFTSGSATLPTGLVRVISLVHATYGALTESTPGVVRDRRVWDTTGIPSIYAVQGTTIITAATYTGNLTLDYEGTLTGLSSGNTTNWLITYAPQAYLSMCLHFLKAREEDPTAPAYKLSSLKTLEDLGMQSMVMQQGRASITIPGPTP